MTIAKLQSTRMHDLTSKPHKKNKRNNIFLAYSVLSLYKTSMRLENFLKYMHK